ncbi:hypothetical protein PVAG01_01298 [Phlyctema vagabunda]|uniref:Uncharacterized protein n=1 Tax=Phlyctema vagabunda TaxID=108571 RepID=A0ABR4PWQ4_9HELO
MVLLTALLAATAVVGLARAQIGENVNSLDLQRSTVDFTASNDLGLDATPTLTASPTLTDAVITSISPSVTGFMTTAGGINTSDAGGFTIQTETSVTNSASESATAPAETASGSAAPSVTPNAAAFAPGAQKGLLGVGMGFAVGLAGIL